MIYIHKCWYHAHVGCTTRGTKVPGGVQYFMYVVTSNGNGCITLHNVIIKKSENDNRMTVEFTVMTSIDGIKCVDLSQFSSKIKWPWVMGVY